MSRSIIIILASILTVGLGGCASDTSRESSNDQASVPAETKGTEPADPIASEPVPAETPETEPQPEVKPEPELEPEAEPMPDPEPDPEPEAVPEPDPEPEPDPAPAKTPEEPAPDPEEPPSNVVVPSGPVRVEASKEGLTAIGVERCAKCHKVQHASWLETKHAQLTPPLDCEACHGPGSEYKSIKIMKDPQASRAAGLVDPTPEFCARCHVAGWEDDMMARSHAHKTPE